MAISIEIATLQDLIESGRYQPASVQRAYQWTSKQATQLITDLVEFMRRRGFSPADSLEDDQVGGALAAQRRGATDRKAPEVYYLNSVVLVPAPRAAGVF